jgi:molybdopterin molybdotransferase
VRSVEEAQAAILSTARLMPGELVSLDRCRGRVPAAFQIAAAVDVPPFDNSAMDGYALRAADTPGTLRLTGEVAAGAGSLPTVEQRTAVRIMTGAPVPPGADAVAQLEIVDERDGAITVPAIAAGTHVRPAGGDTPSGALVQLPPAPLSPAAVAVLASLGIAQLEVRRCPRVAVLSTGSELRAPGKTLGPGQIHDANSLALAAAVEEAGGEPLTLRHVADDAAAIAAALRGAARDADVVIASGGVSVGRHDHVRGAIEEQGRLDFWRIRMQPGKPLAFGVLGEGSLPVIGLPGNPVSALVTFELFVRPLVRAMLGLQGSGRVLLRATARERIGKDPERRAYLRVRVERSGDGYVARGAGGQGSAQLRPLAGANALLVVPEGESAAEPGTAYDALVIGEIS